MSPVLTIQKRMMQLGRVRLGEKGPKGEPRKLQTFRFTSASERLLQAVASMHGGTVQPWEGAPDEGYFQVTTAANRLEIILPPVFSDEDGSPTVPYSQWFELWSKGGCQRRCDGVTEALTGGRCLCDPVKRDAGAVTECKIVTRVQFMLPDLPGLGVWRLDSGGWNAAVELPGTLELLSQAANQRRFIPAVLSIQNRTRKVDGQTRRFIVPVIDLPDITVRQLSSGDVPAALNAPLPRGAERPALPVAPPPPEPDRNGFDHSDGEAADFGSPPPLPSAEEVPRMISDSQRTLLWATCTSRAVEEESLREIVFATTGQRSTKLIPFESFDAVLKAVEALGRAAVSDDEMADAERAAGYVAKVGAADSWVNGLTLAEIRARGEDGEVFFRWALSSKNQGRNLKAACRAYAIVQLPHLLETVPA